MLELQLAYESKSYFKLINDISGLIYIYIYGDSYLFLKICRKKTHESYILIYLFQRCYHNLTFNCLKKK